MTLNGHFTLNSVLAHVGLERFRWIFKSNRAKVITYIPIILAESKELAYGLYSFWQYEVFADIRGGIDSGQEG